MQTLYFRSEPLDGPSPGTGTFVVVQPEHHEWRIHNAHPDRRVIDSMAYDVLVLRRRRYRMLAVQRFRDGGDPWFETVAECLEWIAEWDRENEKRMRRWWAEHAAGSTR